MENSVRQRIKREATARRLKLLMQQCQKDGNSIHYERARTELFSLYQNLALSIGRQCAKQKKNDLDDVYQECRLAVVEAIDRWDMNHSSLLQSVIYRVRSRVYHCLRRQELVVRPESVYRQSKQRMCQFGDDNELGPIPILSIDQQFDLERHWLMQLPDPAPGPEQLFLQAEERRQIREALSALTPTAKEYVVLYYGLEGQAPRTLQEIGQMKGHTRQMTDYHLKRARPILAEALTGMPS